MVQPLATVTVERPWQWGIAILSDPVNGGDVPDVDPERTVSSNQSGVVVLVRHAQDSDVVDDEGDLVFAQAKVTVTYWPSMPEIARPDGLVLDQVIGTPSGRLSVGDAEYEVTLPCPHGVTRLRIFVSDQAAGAATVWVDAIPMATEQP